MPTNVDYSVAAGGNRMKTEGMRNQFFLTRNKLKEVVDHLSEPEADFQPEGFSNTVRWQLGHLLVSAESFMFGYPQVGSPVPEIYASFFERGTAPSRWQRSAPSLTELKKQLEAQEKRLAELPDEYWSEKVTSPIPGMDIKDREGLFHLLLHHEAMHLGQIQSIKRLIAVESR